MSADEEAATGGWIILRHLPRESELRAVLVSLIVCLSCSAAIALAVSLLRPYQEANRAQERQAQIAAIIASAPGLAGILDSSADRSEGAGGGGKLQLAARLVDLESGEYVTEVEPEDFDAQSAARDPERGVAIAEEADIAGLGRRARWARVYLVRDRDERLRLLVLPVEGAGYASTMRGYLALEPDLRTIRALSFYEHAETPGLGAEIDAPDWQASWAGKLAFDPQGRPAIAVDRDRVDPADPNAAYRVDGISGATRTGVGVTNLLRYWLGPHGFGPYLQRLAEAPGRSETEDTT